LLFPRLNAGIDGSDNEGVEGSDGAVREGIFIGSGAMPHPPMHRPNGHGTFALAYLEFELAGAYSSVSRPITQAVFSGAMKLGGSMYLRRLS